MIKVLVKSDEFCIKNDDFSPAAFDKNPHEGACSGGQTDTISVFAAFTLRIFVEMADFNYCF